MKKRNPWLIVTIVLLVFSILLTAAIPVTAYYETMINAALNAKTQKIIPGEDSKIFYWTDYESEEDLVNNDMAVCRQVEAEGAALLLNKNNALPLAADAKMSLFSQSAVDPVLTGTGSAFMGTGDAVSLYAALQDSFAPVLWNVPSATRSKWPVALSDITAECRILEIPTQTIPVRQPVWAESEKDNPAESPLITGREPCLTPGKNRR